MTVGMIGQGFRGTHNWSHTPSASRLRNSWPRLRILGMGLDTATANGRLMLNVLGSVAQFEREVMLERQRGGIAKAKSEG